MKKLLLVLLFIPSLVFGQSAGGGSGARITSESQHPLLHKDNRIVTEAYGANSGLTVEAQLHNIIDGIGIYPFTYLTLAAPDQTVTQTPNFSGGLTGLSVGILEGGANPVKYSYFQGGDQGADITYTLPTAVGSAGTVLTDAAGNGVLSWEAGGGGGMVYPGAGIALSTGAAWDTSITNNSANWNTAYGWGNHAGLYLPIGGGTLTGNLFLGTIDQDGTPAIGRLTVKGSTNDGSTNIFVGRDSDEANVFSINTDGGFTANGSSTIGGGEAGVDYTLTFNGETNDGVITWLEDEDTFDMACGLRVASGTTDTSGVFPITSTDILAWTFDTSHNLWAVMSDGLYKSTDYGTTFVAADLIGTTQTFSSVLVATNGYIYWCPQGYGKIRRSTNGSTFGDVASYTATGSGGWSLTEDNLGYIYMGIYTTVGNNQQKILRSTDNGANWTDSYSGSGWHIHDVYADPYQAGYIYATCDPGAVGGETWKIIRSTNNGVTWSTIDEGSSYIKINSISGARFFGADDVNGTIVKTIDDSTFTTLYQSGTSIVSFATARIGSTVYFGQVRSGGASGIGQLLSTDGSTTRVEWQGTDTTSWTGVLGLSVDNGILYVATYGADNSFKLYPSTNIKTRSISNDGDIVIAPDTKGVLIDGGVNIGSTLLAGDNNLRVEGTSLLIGNITTGAGIQLAGGYHIYPSSDSTAAINITKADNSTHVMTIDTTNTRIGVGAAPVSPYWFQIGTPGGTAADFWCSANDAAGHGVFVGYDNTYRMRLTEKTINCYNNSLTLYSDSDILLNPATNIVYTDSVYPVTDNTYYLGKNDDDTPKAWKGLILKDQAGTGKYYRLEVYNDALRIVDLTD